LCFGNKIKFCECDSKYILKEDGGIRVVYIRSFTKVMAVTVLIMFLLFGLTQTLLAQQPAGKILKKDIPQTKTAPAATRSVLTGKMLENIKITNLSVQDPQLNCIGEWNAVIVNPNNADLTFAVEVYQFDTKSGQWHTVGPAQSVQLTQNEQKPLRGQWERRMHAQKLKLSVKRAYTVYKEREITLPALPSPNVEITEIAITDTGYRVHITNKGTAAQCFLGRQCYKMAEQTGPTTGGLGGVPIKLPGSSTIVSNGHPSAGWKTGTNFIKCDIRNLATDTVVTTKTVPVIQ